MSYRIRAALPKDIRALYDLAKLTGGGFTNLPAERATLEAKLERSEAGFGRKLRAHKVTSAGLTDYVERIVRTYLDEREEGERFASWALRADEEKLR